MVGNFFITLSCVEVYLIEVRNIGLCFCLCVTIPSLMACSHQANAKAKKIKEQSEEIKEKFQTSKKIFTFAFAFAGCEWALKESKYSICSFKIIFWGKVIHLHVSVCPQGEGVSLKVPPLDTDPPGQISWTQIPLMVNSGRYASY